MRFDMIQDIFQLFDLGGRYIPDPEWHEVCNCFQDHYWDCDEPCGFFLLPGFRDDEPSYDEDGEEYYPVIILSKYVCSSCGVEIKPGFKHTNLPFSYPGRIRHLIDGYEVHKEEFDKKFQEMQNSQEV